MTLIRPDWTAPANVRAIVTTRAEGDMAGDGVRGIAHLLPSEPVWLRQVHGTTVVDAATRPQRAEADASISRSKDVVCAVRLADCMPVLLSAEDGTAVAAAHAGWRGLCAGVIERTIEALAVPPSRLLAWLGPAIGPEVYEVGEEVRAAFLAQDPAAEHAFVASRPGHWRLDLYTVARQRLTRMGVSRLFGGNFCTYSEERRFFSYRRDRAKERMAALIWLAS
jgi:YfiH family protein